MPFGPDLTEKLGGSNARDLDLRDIAYHIHCTWTAGSAAPSAMITLPHKVQPTSNESSGHGPFGVLAVLVMQPASLFLGVP